MSELRVTISGHGFNKFAKLTEENEGRGKSVTINGKTFKLYDACLDDSGLFFITGWSEECYAEIADIRKNIALCSPEQVFNYYKYSTYTGLRNSFNFGCIDGEYKEWEDCQSYAYRSLRLECEGIGLIPQYGETDAWGCTRALVNGKEFWLYNLHYEEDYIEFDIAENGTHNSNGLIAELTKAIYDKTVIAEYTDFETGEETIYEYSYQPDTDEVIEEYQAPILGLWVGLECDRLSDILKYGEKEDNGYTHLWVNGKEFLLNIVFTDESWISLSEFDESKDDNIFRFINELTKALNGKKMKCRLQDRDGFLSAYDYFYDSEKDELSIEPAKY